MSKFFNSLVKATSDAFRSSLADFDFDAEVKSIKNSLAESSKRISREFKKLNKHIHNYFDKWVVDVDYNQDEDTISSRIKENTLTITVRKEDGEGETQFSTTIPSDVVISSLVQKYDPTKKKALFIFTKKDEITEE